jgi:uncharacterized integral membrane protein (TIGR00698 family)
LWPFIEGARVTDSPSKTADPLKTPGHFILPLGLIFAISPWASSATALLLGVFIVLLFGNPYIARTRKLTRPLLSNSIIGLGAGVNLMVVAKAGLDGILFTAVALSATLLVGWLLGRLLKTDPETSLLINVGTAICGGSAIAAVSSAIRAQDHDTSVSLAVVFVLNACALIIFPPLGHHFLLTEGQFGLWSALAIHDTSSVVGATMQYGNHALEVGTTVKLVRALWIIPVTLIIAKIYAKKNSGKDGRPTQYPWFILGFLLMSALVTWVPQLGSAGHFIELIAKRALIVTLFLIGAGLTRATLQKVGFRPLVQGVVLWFIVASCNLIVVMHTPP